MFEPRDYQEEAVSRAYSGLSAGKNTLWVMPTGAGKAYCLAMLADRLGRDGHRVLVVIDQRNLVEQLAQTFTAAFPGMNLDIACTGVQKGFSRNAKVLIGSRQTISGRVDDVAGYDVIMLDEAHEVRPMSSMREMTEGEGQYYKIISRIAREHGGALLHGCTATPWRLKHGYIYGKKCRIGFKNYFDSATYHVSYEKLIEGGNIVKPVFYKEPVFNRVDVKIDVNIGDYVTESISTRMREKIGNEILAYKKYLASEKYSIAFTCDIAHCDALVDGMVADGLLAYPMHSKTGTTQEDVLARFRETGGLLVTVDQASKGFDFPEISGALMVRPTKSPAICFQHIGRPLRKFAGKEFAVIVDMCGNTDEHMLENDLDRPVVEVYNPIKQDGNGEEVVSFCSSFKRPRKSVEVDQVQHGADLAMYQHGSSDGLFMAEVVAVEARIVGRGTGQKVRIDLAVSGWKRKVPVFICPVSCDRPSLSRLFKLGADCFLSARELAAGLARFPGGTILIRYKAGFFTIAEDKESGNDNSRS